MKTMPQPSLLYAKELSHHTEGLPEQAPIGLVVPMPARHVPIVAVASPTPEPYEKAIGVSDADMVWADDMQRTLEVPVYEDALEAWCC